MLAANALIGITQLQTKVLMAMIFVIARIGSNVIFQNHLLRVTIPEGYYFTNVTYLLFCTGDRR